MAAHPRPPIESLFQRGPRSAAKRRRVIQALEEGRPKTRIAADEQISRKMGNSRRQAWSRSAGR